ncbi:MAG: site-specific integrase [Deltaproteobacteria bacterium]|nr:site-specific integrase [Deltaproteobacteria bacterium]
MYCLVSAVKMHNGKPDECFYITFNDGGGRKVWEKIGWRSEGISQATAVGKRKERMEALRVGAPVDQTSRTLTFGAAWEEWERTHLPTLKDRSNIVILAKKHVLPRFKNRAMNSITALDLDRMKLELGESGRSAQTIKHTLGLIRRVYRKALVWGIYHGPVPTTAIKMPRTDNARMRWLTQEEASALLGKLRLTSPLWHDITLLSLHTGMRLDDILQLRCRQVNMVSGIIDVIEAKPGTYTAYLSDRAKKMLAGRMVGSDASDLVFPSPRTAGKIFKAGKPFLKAVKECGFNEGVTNARYKVVFHTLRHTFASWLVQKGVFLSEVAELMGHASTRMTERYAKLSPKSKRIAVNIIGEMLHS